MTIEKMNLDYIIETLTKCNGIRIILLCNTWDRLKEISDLISVLTWQEYLSGNSMVDYEVELKFRNRSELICLLKDKDYFCGVRADQIILDGEFSEKEIQELARPLICHMKWNVFKTGIFKLVGPELQ